MTNKDEEQDWLDALAGKPNPNADPEVTRQATLLRLAIQRHDDALGVNDFDVEAGLQKLKVRLVREGLSGADQSITIKERFAQLAGIVSAVLAICSILFIALIPVELGVATRGSIHTQVIFVKNPNETANLLTAELLSIGRTAKTEQKSSYIVVNIDEAPANQSEASHNKEWDVFERYSITVGGVKAFQLEIHPESKPAKDGH